MASPAFLCLITYIPFCWSTTCNARNSGCVSSTRSMWMTFAKYPWVPSTELPSKWSKTKLSRIYQFRWTSQYVWLMVWGSGFIVTFMRTLVTWATTQISWALSYIHCSWKPWTIAARPNHKYSVTLRVFHGHSRHMATKLASSSFANHGVLMRSCQNNRTQTETPRDSQRQVAQWKRKAWSGVLTL